MNQCYEHDNYNKNANEIAAFNYLSRKYMKWMQGIIVIVNALCAAGEFPKHCSCVLLPKNIVAVKSFKLRNFSALNK